MSDWPFTFSVTPQIPPRIESLREIAYNLWWSWNESAISLFRRLDPVLWEECHHNPVRLLRKINQSSLVRAANDGDFCKHLDEVMGQLNAYLSKGDRWYRKTYPDRESNLVAYFSAEFGFHESLPIYSGGLGILAGDHCKAASDLGIPFIAVGLLYRLGYFKQRINKEGWQESEQVNWNFYELPITEVRVGDDAKPLLISVQLPGRLVYAKVWQVRVGLIRLFLLDTDILDNNEEDRKITYQLYGGDHEMRIKQEIVLGIGGVRAIREMDLHPMVYHLNEGHAAFLSLERIRRRMVERQLGFQEALQAVAASNHFTTHTPVPAGNDAFSPELMGKYFTEFARECKMGFDEFIQLGRPWENKAGDPFSMTILALRTSRQSNGVSAIHGRVSREMWQVVWPGVPQAEIPIDHITNGIHTLTWMAPEIRSMIERVGGAFWEDNCSNKESWKCIEKITDEELWAVHQKLKIKLIQFVRKNLHHQRMRAGYSAVDIRGAEDVLDPRLLTIGFARRFATYKRANLLFRDLARLEAIVNHPERPVQFVFAGKAHPADDGGKRLIQRIYQVAQMPQFKNRIVFIENYDIDVARHMYHGVDVWLNNPTRPLEASGTSGEKVCPNGGINLSVRDGWWDEAIDGTNGWAIGEEVQSPDPAVQDEFDCISIYSLIEHQIAPLYYRRNSSDLPHEWMQWMRRSMETVGPEYNTFRMVQDYANKFYLSAGANGQKLRENDYQGSIQLAAWKQRIRANWHEVQAKEVHWKHPSAFRVSVGDEFAVECKVHLGPLAPEEVQVEAYVRMTSGTVYRTTTLSASDKLADGWFLYKGVVQAGDSGTYQFNVRVLPYHPNMVQKHELRLTTWAK